jgi:RNA polymerase sigma factor (sigma-70 family)
MSSAVATERGGEARFVTTRWSLIVTSSDVESDDEKVRQALSELCRIYWRPIVSFICLRGYSACDAQDLAQDFFVRILEGNWLKNADPKRGRFRWLLLKSLRNFLSDASAKRQALKRGGDLDFVSWDEWMAEAPSKVTVSSESIKSWDNERLFDLRWAATIVEQAVRRLREECESQGRLGAFEILRPCLGAERDEVSYIELAHALGVPEPTVKNLVHRLRQRYRSLLRREVADTVANPADVDDEIRHLCGVLAINGAEIS